MDCKLTDVCTQFHERMRRVWQQRRADDEASENLLSQYLAEIQQERKCQLQSLADEREQLRSLSQQYSIDIQEAENRMRQLQKRFAENAKKEASIKSYFEKHRTDELEYFSNRMEQISSLREQEDIDLTSGFAQATLSIIGFCPAEMHDEAGEVFPSSGFNDQSDSDSDESEDSDEPDGEPRVEFKGTDKLNRRREEDSATPFIGQAQKRALSDNEAAAETRAAKVVRLV